MHSISLTRAAEVWTSLAPLHKVAAAGAAVRRTQIINPRNRARLFLMRCKQVAAAAFVISNLGNPKTKRTPGMLGARVLLLLLLWSNRHCRRNHPFRSWEERIAE
jgi:hypothetical protein